MVRWITISEVSMIPNIRPKRNQSTLITWRLINGLPARITPTNPIYFFTVTCARLPPHPYWNSCYLFFMLNKYYHLYCYIFHPDFPPIWHNYIRYWSLVIRESFTSHQGNPANDCRGQCEQCITYITMHVVMYTSVH